MSDPAQFGITPDLVCTEPDRNKRALENLLHEGGDCREGDTFLLATDALACWAIGAGAVESCARLAAIKDQSEFASLVAELRAADVRNDDMTLLIVEVRSQPDLPATPPAGEASEEEQP
jgi:hypothetical protein